MNFLQRIKKNQENVSKMDFVPLNILGSTGDEFILESGNTLFLPETEFEVSEKEKSPVKEILVRGSYVAENFGLFKYLSKKTQLEIVNLK